MAGNTKSIIISVLIGNLGGRDILAKVSAKVIPIGEISDETYEASAEKVFESFL